MVASARFIVGRKRRSVKTRSNSRETVAVANFENMCQSSFIYSSHRNALMSHCRCARDDPRFDHPFRVELYGTSAVTLAKCRQFGALKYFRLFLLPNVLNFESRICESSSPMRPRRSTMLFSLLSIHLSQ